MSLGEAGKVTHGLILCKPQYLLLQGVTVAEVVITISLHKGAGGLKGYPWIP